jgi:mRNA interferase MazF
VVIRQGELYWFTVGGHGSEPRGRRPALVVQDDRYNRTPIATTVVAAITSNLRLAAAPGNVRLRKGEAKLSKASVIDVTQLQTIDKVDLTERIGVLDRDRLTQVLDGIALVFGLDDVREGS